MGKLIHGVGINDLTGQSNTPYYRRWASMLGRCYDPKIQSRSPSYYGCSVHPDWHFFSNFRSWMAEQNWYGLALDKDLLIEGCRVYGPNSCLFIDEHLNGFLAGTGVRFNPKQDYEPYQRGVKWSDKLQRFTAHSVDHYSLKPIHLGVYDTEDQAHYAWRKHKAMQAHDLAAARETSNPRAAEALRRRFPLLP